MNENRNDIGGPYAAFRYAAFRRYAGSNALFNLGRHALVVAIALQITEWTNSAAAIGFIGFINVAPLLAFFLPAGVLADRVDKRKIITFTSGLSCLFSILLLLCTVVPVPDADILRGANGVIRDIALFFTASENHAKIHFDNPALPLVFLLQFCHATVRVFSSPARVSIIPLLVPHNHLSGALSWNASAFQLTAVIGPLFGGLLAANGGFSIVYAFDAVFSAALALSFAGIKLIGEQKEKQKENVGMDASNALAGVAFIFRHKPVLAAISLDLFAVLLGGLTALFPLFARDVLQGDATVAGLLYAAAPLGAVVMAFIIAHLPQFRRPGVVLLWSVACFGGTLLAFACSRNLALSLAALFASGMCDHVSVVIRHTLVQLLTPELLRGRVTAVNQLFVGSSNEISELRGGLMAARYGPVGAATIGSICTLCVVAGVALALPSLRTVPPLDKLKPAEE
ncbi:MAG: MFS transporter [Puniceicoccales bacterium]|jgi:MFS family permease|nr:MFS transporter [Puniceicoccales bacterium]